MVVSALKLTVLKLPPKSCLMFWPTHGSKLVAKTFQKSLNRFVTFVNQGMNWLDLLGLRHLLRLHKAKLDYSLLTSTNCSQIQKSIYCKNSLTVTACCVNLLTIFRSRTEMLFPRIDASKFERYFQTRSSPLRKLSTTAQSTSHGHRGLGGLRRRWLELAVDHPTTEHRQVFALRVLSQNVK